MVPCRQCPLGDCPGLIAHDADRIAVMESFKQGEMRLLRGAAVYLPGENPRVLGTVLEGLLLRYKLLADGRRQILNVMFPGDLVGLQAIFGEPHANGLEALTNARLCQFERDRFFDLVTNDSRFAYEVIWLAAEEEAALEEILAAVGQRSARERAAFLAVHFFERGIATGLVGADHRLGMPLSQLQIADILGLSLVHVNRTLGALRRDGLVIWAEGGIRIQDLNAARAYCQYEARRRTARPYL